MKPIASVADGRSDRPQKRQRLGLMERPAPSGALCASKSSAILHDHYPAEIKEIAVDKPDIFFPDNSYVAPSSEIIIGDNVKRALKDRRLSENELRNAIYTDLKHNHGVQFPVSSSRWESEIMLRRIFGRNERYQETPLKALLNEFYESRLSREEGLNAILIQERLLKGLNVTTTCLPNLTVLRARSLHFGEIKNGGTFSISNASKQCALYLCALLYFFRVHMGMKVRSVFGFCLCGYGCFGAKKNEYAVGLVRLSAPEHLGDSLLSQVFWTQCRTDDLFGVQLLVHFLRNGKTQEIGGEIEQVIAASHRIPALLTLPEALWNSPHLVSNGTTSMVFCGNKDEITRLLERFPPSLDRRWEIFEGQVSDFFKSLKPADSTKHFYLKVRLKDTSLRPNPANSVNELFGKYQQQYYDTYCVLPYGTDQLGVFLMHDCGDTVKEETIVDLGFHKFCSIFSILWGETKSLCDSLFHGDALPHNLVYNAVSQKLTLIDLDEGTVKANAPKRILEDDSVVYAYLRYPNFLRAWTQALLYTQIQLVASFLLLTSPSGLFDNLNDEKSSVDKLHRMAAMTEEYLKSNDGEDPTDFGLRQPPDCLHQTISTLEEILNQFSSPRGDGEADANNQYGSDRCGER